MRRHWKKLALLLGAAAATLILFAIISQNREPSYQGRKLSKWLHYPALLSDVLDGLLSMTDTNWPDLAEELAQMLRPLIAAGSQSAPNAKTPIRSPHSESQT